MKIKYYSNACGTGKTTKLKDYIQSHPMAYFLVIVPGMKLAEEYSTHGTVIVSKSSDESVLSRIADAIINKTQVLVITAQAFSMCSFKDKLVKDRIVIQDEAMDVVSAKKLKLNNHPSWIPVFELTDLNNGWHKVKFNASKAAKLTKEADSFDDFAAVKELLSTPAEMWANNANFDENTTFFSLTSPSIYEGARRVIIACANFEHTFQYRVWTTVFDVEFECAEAFVPYAGTNTHIHYAQQKVNSLIYNRKNPNIRHAAINYIVKNSGRLKVVVVDNPENHGSLPREWTKLKNNCHGENGHRDAKHIAYLSAINYDNLRITFMHDICGMEPMAVEAALIGEMAHQVLMRGVLRDDNNAECHFYLMGRNIAFHLAANVFVNAQLHHIPDTEREEQAKAALKPLTQMERNKANHIKKVHTQFNNMDTRALMQHACWLVCSDRGTISKKAKSMFTDRQIAAALEV